MIGMGHCSMINAAIAAACDPYWSYTTCMFNFEGADNSTSMIDLTGRATWTAQGGAKLSTSSPLIGTSSLYLDEPTASCVVTSTGLDLASVSTGPQTYEFVIKCKSLPTGGARRGGVDTLRVLLSQSEDISFSQIFLIGIGMGGTVRIAASSVTFPFDIETNPILLAGVKYYIKITVDGINIKICVDDILVKTVAYAHFLNLSPQPIGIGCNYIPSFSHYMYFFDGTIDAVRISSIVRPSGSGIVPTDNYPSIAC